MRAGVPTYGAMSSSSAPRVHVDPDAAPLIAEAVQQGGGRLVGAGEAEAIVWTGSPDGLAAVLRDGVRWVQLPSAGVESWLAAGVIDGERQWTSATGAYAHQVAEHALALILALARRIPECARADEWGERYGRTLRGATVAVVGAGGIGQALIEMLAPLRVEVVAITRSGRDVPGAMRSLPAERLGDVWAEADVVVVAAPATDDTRHLLGEAELAALPDDALVINIARGSLIDTDALASALAAGRLGGAGLDVTDPEPLPAGHPLWSEPRALITPHSANPPSALMRGLADRVAENVARYAAGEDLIGRIDPERGY